MFLDCIQLSIELLTACDRITDKILLLEIFYFLQPKGKGLNLRSLDSLRCSLLKHQGNQNLADSTVPRFLQAEETMKLNEKTADSQVLSSVLFTLNSYILTLFQETHTVFLLLKGEKFENTSAFTYKVLNGIKYFFHSCFRILKQKKLMKANTFQTTYSHFGTKKMIRCSVVSRREDWNLHLCLIQYMQRIISKRQIKPLQNCILSRKISLQHGL